MDSRLDSSRAIATHGVAAEDVEMRLRPQRAESHINTSDHVLAVTPSLEAPNVRYQILILIASFTLIFTVCGMNFAFGVYQELYQSIGGPFESASPASIDLIGSLGISLMSFGAPFATSWSRAFSPKLVTFLGATLFGIGNIVASFGQSLWVFIVFQGIIVGCGTCLAYIPAVTITPGWFGARRAMAMGFVTSGTGVGGIVWAPAIRALNAHFGFRNTLRLTGGLSFLLVACAGSVLRWDPASQRRTELELRGRSPYQRLNAAKVNWRIIRSREFLSQALSSVLQAASYYTPIYFLSAYSRVLGYSDTSGANFIAISNGCSAVGKVILGYLADRFGRLNMLFLCTFIGAASALCFWLPSTLWVGEERAQILFVSFAIVYGIFAGAFISLFPTALMEVFGPQNFLSVNGFLYMLRGVSSLIGTPTTGLLLRSDGISAPGMIIGYRRLSSTVGALMLGASFATLWVRLQASIPGASAWKR